MTTDVTVQLDRVSKSFGDFTAVKELSLTVRAGRVFGLLGPNGAGKTTTIRMIVNITVPDSGTINVFGGKSRDASGSWKSNWSIVPILPFAFAKVFSIPIRRAQLRTPRNLSSHRQPKRQPLSCVKQSPRLTRYALYRS